MESEINQSGILFSIQIKLFIMRILCVSDLLFLKVFKV